MTREEATIQALQGHIEALNETIINVKSWTIWATEPMSEVMRKMGVNGTICG